MNQYPNVDLGLRQPGDQENEQVQPHQQYGQGAGMSAAPNEQPPVGGNQPQPYENYPFQAQFAPDMYRPGYQAPPQYYPQMIPHPYFGQSYQIFHNNTTKVKENQHKNGKNKQRIIVVDFLIP